MRIMSYPLMREEILYLLNRDGAQSIDQIHGQITGQSRIKDYRVSSCLMDLREAGAIIQEGHMLCLTAAGRAELAAGRQA